MSGRRRRRGAADGPAPINLALQGGGAHGAFTWGVLDGLLADGRVAIEGISGTSAGAMNAVVLADGLMDGGEHGARAALEAFWQDVSRLSHTSPIQKTVWDAMNGSWNLDASPGYLMFDLMTRLASPYDLNPMNINPVREVLERHVDFDRVHHCDRVKLFISATRVSTGRVKIFECKDITADAVMASACLPHLFQAVEIDGEAYWDGGFIGNPALYPLIYNCASRDIVIVQINPLEREGTPKTAREILNRVNEITFNASLMKELRAISFVTKLLDEGSLDGSRYKRILMHLIEADDEMAHLNASSKLNSEWAFLSHLKEIGRTAAAGWLDRHAEDLGKQSTVDIREMFM